jgi:hypothetical protein
MCISGNIGYVLVQHNKYLSLIDIYGIIPFIMPKYSILTLRIAEIT